MVASKVSRPCCCFVLFSVPSSSGSVFSRTHWFFLCRIHSSATPLPFLPSLLYPGGRSGRSLRCSTASLKEWGTEGDKVALYGGDPLARGAFLSFSIQSHPAAWLSLTSCRIWGRGWRSVARYLQRGRAVCPPTYPPGSPGSRVWESPSAPDPTTASLPHQVTRARRRGARAGGL